MDILIKAHSGLRYLVIALLLMAIFKAFSRWKGRHTYTPANKKLYMMTLMLIHVQLVIGLILYFLGPKVPAFLEVGGVMGNGVSRFFVMEHLVGMIIGIALITFGYSKSKRLADDEKKHRMVAITYLIGTIIILLSIPWPFRDLGTGWI